MNEDLGGSIPTGDWETYAQVRDLPLYLWRQLREKIEQQEEQWKKEGRADSKIDIMADSPRLEFALLGRMTTLDPRLIARMYRGWWARVLFPSEMGFSLRRFIKVTKDWPNSTGRGIERQLKSLNIDGKNSQNPERINLDRFIGSTSNTDEYARLGDIWANDKIVVEGLRRVEERQIDRLIEYGDAPSGFRSMLAALVIEFVREPEQHKGIQILLNDVFLPDFTDDSSARSSYDSGRFHFAVRDAPPKA
jgi:hypothetical protein